MKPRLGKFDVVSIDDLSTADIERVFALADEFSAALDAGRTLDIANGLVMATLFYEPSTRTRLSFESAMHRLGGRVISSADMQSSSAAKGESLADTVRVVGNYADVIVMRHPNDGSARAAADYAPCPIINAGDGSREHPTQTLCDLYILLKKKGHLKGLTVALCGDLKFGRTVHSLMYALARFGANIVTVPTAGMEVPAYVLDRLAAERNYNLSTVTIDELKSLAGGLDAMYLTPNAPHQMALFTGDESVPAAQPPAALDAFYITRMQKERMTGAQTAPGDYVHFDARALRTARTQEAVVMHPLPRTTELSHEMDADPRAIYFEQAAAGVPVRMALLAWIREKSAAYASAPARAGKPIGFRMAAQPRCANANCITRTESTYLRARFLIARHNDPNALILRCDYCERELKIEFVGHARSHRYYKFDENLRGYASQWIEEGSFAVFDSVKQAEESGYEPYKRGPQRELMNEAEVARAVDAIADQIIADASDLTGHAIVGVVSHGAMLALRIREVIGNKTGTRPPCAAVDVYAPAGGLRAINGHESFDVADRNIVLVDDVINSGWTVQRAMGLLWQAGRPASMKLAVLIDRGHRTLPIRPNYVGKNVPTARGERVEVRLAAEARNGKSRTHDRVTIYSMVEALKSGEQAS
jgi:aspartate carbamoyltransferase catalytic subunit